MAPDGEDAFLPTENDRLKAQIKELQVRLAMANDKEKKLRKQIITEDLSYIVVSNLTEAIKDPTRIQAHEIEGIEKAISDQLLSTAETCTINEYISYHRLAGRTTFEFSKHYFGIRLETFYKKVYKEPYYLLFLKKDTDRIVKPDKVDKHTIPQCIPLEVLSKRFLPHNMETFIRIIHDNVQAFVSRRELISELETLGSNLKMIYKNGSYTRVEMQVEPYDQKPTLAVTLLFQNYASGLPTEIIVQNADSAEEQHDFTELQQTLLTGDMVHILQEYITVMIAPVEENVTEPSEQQTEEQAEEQTGQQRDDQNEENQLQSELSDISMEEI